MFSLSLLHVFVACHDGYPLCVYTDQPMTIEFYNPAPKRVANAPSLINRIQKPPLLDRLGQEQGESNGKTSYVLFPLVFLSS